jgi:hypothetical protein
VNVPKPDNISDHRSITLAENAPFTMNSTNGVETFADKNSPSMVWFKLTTEMAIGKKTYDR